MMHALLMWLVLYRAYICAWGVETLAWKPALLIPGNLDMKSLDSTSSSVLLVCLHDAIKSLKRRPFFIMFGLCFFWCVFFLLMWWMPYCSTQPQRSVLFPSQVAQAKHQGELKLALSKLDLPHVQAHSLEQGMTEFYFIFCSILINIQACFIAFNWSICSSRLEHRAHAGAGLS